MSQDVASLVLAVDSTPVKGAVSALQAFTQAASPATSAVTALTAASQSASVAVAGGTESFRGQREVVRGLASDVAIFGGSLGQAVGTAGLLYLENARLVEGFGGFRNAVAEIATPTNLFVGGLVATVAAGALAYESVLKQVQAYSELSDKTNTAVASLRGLDTSAAGKGITDTDFNSAIEKFNESVLQANNGTGELAGLLRANGEAAGTMVDDLAKVADLVANAKNSAQQYQILQEAGLPQTQSWVRYLSQGGDAIRAASANANTFSAAEQVMVDKARDLEDAFSATWKSIKNDGTSAVITLGAKLDELKNSSFFDYVKAALSLGSLGGRGVSPSVKALPDADFSGVQASSAFGKPSGNPSRSNADALADLSRSSAYISLLGQTASAAYAMTLKENELDRSYLETGVTLNGPARSAVLALAYAESLGTLQIQSQTDSFRTQAGAIGLGVGAVQAFTTEQNLLNEAARNHKPLADADTASIHAYAESLGVAAQAAAYLKLQSDTNFNTSQLGRTDVDQNVATQLRSLYGDNYQSHMNDAIAGQIRFNDELKTTKDAAGSAFSTILQDLRDGKSGVVTLTDALTGLENKLFDIISNQAASALFKGGLSAGSDLFGGSSFGGSGSIFGNSHHTGYGPGDPLNTPRAISVGDIYGAPRFHTGVGPGERAAVIRDDESVLTPGQMKALAPASRASQGGGTVVNINNHSGADIQQSKRTENGVDIVDVMVGAVGRSMASGQLDSALAARPGGRQPVARR